MFCGPRAVVTLVVKIALDYVFALSEHDPMPITPTELQAQAGISKGYASNLLSGKKKPSPKMAVRIFRATGVKLGLIANLPDAVVAEMAEAFSA
jgi:plasmid maintenance system antidote protein VapI